jgi:type IV/VI secretion system ImpK/VasF family protein
MKYFNLVHLCEPVFEYICKVNKIARNGGQIDYHTLRGEILEILETLDKEAEKDDRLRPLFERIRIPLIIFMDESVVQSRINCAEDWEDNRLAYEHGLLSGGEEFFDMMEELEAETSDDASECLSIFYTCLGLGFTGYYGDQTDFIKQRMDKIRPRIRKYIEADPNAPIVPECYEHTDRSDLVEPPGSKLVGIVIAFAGLFAVVFVSVVLLFDQASGDLSRAVEATIAKDPAQSDGN